MKEIRFLIYIFCMVCFCQSCRRQPTLLKEQAYLDSLVSHHPKEALAKLRQLELGEYLHASEAERMKLGLLAVKAGDKAFIPKVSDSLPKRLVSYYEKRGTANERMEAYYYLGSAYRDLHDSPRALKFYLKAVEAADTGEVHFDWYQYSALLEQLAYMYELQSDYKHAIALQQRIMQISGKYASDSVHDHVFLARYYNCADSTGLARIHYGRALGLIREKGLVAQKLPSLGEILGFYTQQHLLEEAGICYRMIRSYEVRQLPPNACAAVGDYFMAIGKDQEALRYLEHADTCFTDIYQKQSNKRTLYELHTRLGDARKALAYARQFVVYTDSVQKAQGLEQARKIGNTHQYYRDAQHEQMLEKNLKQKEVLLLMLVSASLALLLASFLIYNYRLRRRDQKIAAQRMVLTQKETTIETLETQRAASMAQLQKIEAELQQKRKMALSVANAVLPFKQVCCAEESIQDETAWKNLFDAVDVAYPGFFARMQETYGDLGEIDKKMLYLMKAGLKKRQVTDVLGRSPAVLYQHCEKLKKRCGTDVSDFLSE